MAKAENCIAASKSDSLDVRVLKIAESIAAAAGSARRRGHPVAADSLLRGALALREIAAEIRHAATMPCTITLEAILDSFIEARTEIDLSDAWRAAAPSLKKLSLAERQTISEAWITRLCVVCQDDGR